jgi:hypothetical protein
LKSSLIVFFHFRYNSLGESMVLSHWWQSRILQQ